MTVRFECVTRTSVPRKELFELSLSIDAHTESMARSREKAIGGVTRGHIGLGQEVTWQAWHFGFPIRMTSRITELEKPDYFVDEQIRGPFRSFRHVHEFQDDGDTTVMTDRIEFTAPLGFVGRLVEKLVLGRYMRRLIEARNEYLTGARAECLQWKPRRKEQRHGHV